MHKPKYNTTHATIQRFSLSFEKSTFRNFVILLDFADVEASLFHTYHTHTHTHSAIAFNESNILNSSGKIVYTPTCLGYKWQYRCRKSSIKSTK